MYNTKPKNVAELQLRIKQLDITVGVISALVNDLITPLAPKALQMLNRMEAVAIPILKSSTVELIDKCKKDFDGDILLAIIGELGLCYGLDIDLIETIDESQTVKYLLLLSLYDDIKPEGDDDPDDDAPTADIEQTQRVLAMSAGAGQFK